MRSWLFPTTSKGWSVWLALAVVGCATSDPYQDIVHGTIAYPFIEPTHPLGRNGDEEKFVIRTMAGNTEYVVEIPKAAEYYDVEVPIADLKTGDGLNTMKPVKNPQTTDRELVANLPKLSLATREERALLDQAFGVGEPGGPTQAPSYVMGIAKINELYKTAKYEFALVEINNMLSFYPTSAQLYKMKGTVLIRLNNLKLAERAWYRAQELAPNDQVLRKGLDRLQRRIKGSQQSTPKATQEAH